MDNNDSTSYKNHQVYPNKSEQQLRNNYQDIQIDVFQRTIHPSKNFNYGDDMKVQRFGRDLPKSIKLFDTCGICDRLLENVHKANFKIPTMIQKHSIPIILQGRDILATSPTGTGKTAAYLLPVIDLIEKVLQSEISNNSGVCQPVGIILVPVRELVKQISQVAQMFANNTMVNVDAVHGDETSNDPKILDSVHLLSATPRKLLNLLNCRTVSLYRLKYFILDEADKMLEMGFGEEVEKLLQLFAEVKGIRQSIFISATFSPDVHKLAEVYLQEDYVFLTVGHVGVACKDVEQLFIPTDESEKLTKLLHMLDNDDSRKKLIFVRSRALADVVAIVLCEMSFPSISIHGGHSQKQREKAMNDFITGKVNILVSTSLTARGLDIKDVQHVINYDLPDNIAEYVQRIGRTGRMGNLGKSTSFYNYTKDAELSPYLVQMLEKVNQNVPSWLHKACSIAITTDFVETQGCFMKEDNEVSKNGQPNLFPRPFDCTKTTETEDYVDYSSTDSE